MISGKIKNLFVLVSTPALFYYASQLVAEALQLRADEMVPAPWGKYPEF